MKVLHVLCDLAGGGAERLVLDLCRLSGPELQTSVAPVHEGGPLGPAFAAAGVPVHAVGRIRGRPGLRATARLAALAREADLVHTHLWAGDTWGRVAALLAGNRAVVTTEHNTGGESVWRVSLSRALSPVSAAVVCVSEAAAARAPVLGRSRLRVIPNGVDLARFSPRRPHHGQGARVLGLGRLTRQKGFDVLVEAIARSPGLRLDLVGEGEEAAALAAPRVRLHGWRPDVRPFLAEADVLAIPSRWEGFGLVAVEAMASGVPVVASRVDGLIEVVGDAGLLVGPEDPAALAAALQRLAADPALRQDLARRGLARAARFDLRRTVAAYTSLYREVVSRARRQ